MDAQKASLRFAGERRQLACGVRQPAEHNFRRQAADECRLAACAPGVNAMLARRIVGTHALILAIPLIV